MATKTRKMVPAAPAPAQTKLSFDLFKQIIAEEVRRRQSRIVGLRKAILEYAQDMNKYENSSMFSQSLFNKVAELISTEQELEVLLEQQKYASQVE